MAINPLLSLQVEGVDLATPSANIGNAIVQRREDKKEAERQAKEDARFERQEARADRKMDMDEQQFAVTQERENRKMKMLESGFATEQELARLDIANKKLEGMSLREQARVESVIYGAAELGARLDAGDVAGAEQFLTQRRANLAQRRASGEAVDTAETDAALAAIKSGDPKQIEALKGQTKSLTQLGQLMGKLEVPEAAGDPKRKEPPSGYQYKENGELEAIPGGPQARELQEIDRKAGMRLTKAEAKAETVKNSVTDTLNFITAKKAGLDPSGLAGQVTSWMAGSDARQLVKKIETIQANLAFDELQAMREASPTGGALGGVAVRELDLLQSTVANLDPFQKTAELEKELAKVETHYTNWLNAVKQAEENGGDDDLSGLSDDELRKIAGGGN